MVRGSLGRTIDLAASASMVEEYPLYAIPIKTFLELDRWVPHQDLLSQGKLVEVKKENTETEVLFASHQWVSFDHPDPSNDQLRALQSVIRTLMKGKTSVTSNAMLDAIYQYKMVTTGSEWAAKLPKMNLWIDYMSIPQPGAVVAEVSEEMKAKLDANGDGKVDQSELLDAANTGVADMAIRKGRMSSDHRMTETADERIATLVQQLKGAVDSIPSYIERSSMMWVVVPPVKHNDLDDQICDFASWRKRGWCRLEFAASKLACGDDMPLMVIRSEREAPEYFNPCDMFKLCAARGNFSVDSDKDKVNATLGKMLKTKAEYYEKANGDITLSRLVKAFGPVFVPREAYGSAASASASSADVGTGTSTSTSSSQQLHAPANESAVGRLQRFMGWRGTEEEAAWQAETGLNLLTFAAFMDDEAAIDELLAKPKEEVCTLLDAKGAKMVIPGVSKKGPQHRREPLGIKLCTYAEGMTPLIAAMTFASPEIVTKLMDAGANVERDGLLLLGERPCTFRGAALAGKADNIRVLLARYPQYVNSVNDLGACPLHFAAWTSQCLGQAPVMKALIDLGAKPTIRQQHLVIGTPLSAACKTFDQDPEAVRMLLDAGADPQEIDTWTAKLKVLKTLSSIFRKLGNTQMRGMNSLLNGHSGYKKWAPVHAAAARGDISTVRVLAEHSALDPHSMKDRKGRTPLDICSQAMAPCQEVPRLMQQAFKEGAAMAPPAAVASSSSEASSRRGSRQGFVGVTPPQVLPSAKS